MSRRGSREYSLLGDDHSLYGRNASPAPASFFSATSKYAPHTPLMTFRGDKAKILLQSKKHSDEAGAPKRKKKIYSWNSLSYVTSASRMMRQHFAAKSTGNWLRKITSLESKWFIIVCIGFFVGLMAFAVNSTILFLRTWRLNMLNEVLQHVDHSDMYELAVVYLLFVGISVGMVCIGSVIVVFAVGTDRGSGVPEVIAYLNGIEVPKVFNLRTVAVKFFSVICAVSSGIPVSSQGPLINMGAAFAAGFSQGRSKTLKLHTRLFKKFRNPTDLRDFVSAGASSGVSAAFKSPIGGLLFGLEEVSSWWTKRLTLMVLFSCVVASFTVFMFDSAYNGWEVSGIPFGTLDMVNQIMFPMRTQIEAISAGILIPTAVLGVYGGFMGSVYTHINVAANKLRSNYVASLNLRRVMEPCVLCFVYITLCFFLPLTQECMSVPSIPDGAVIPMVPFTCDAAFFNPLASLTLSSNLQVLQAMYDRSDVEAYPAATIAFFLAFYIPMTSIFSGTALSAGSFIPMMTIGAMSGRLLGMLINHMVDMPDDALWCSPGVLALIGSATFTAGVSRLTLSLTVIILEMCWDMTLIMPILMGVVMAKWVADGLATPVYTSIMKSILKMPYLSNDSPDTPFGRRRMYCFIAADVMSHPCVVVQEQESIKHIMDILTCTSHHAFPVVVPLNNKRAKRNSNTKGNVSPPSLDDEKKSSGVADAKAQGVNVAGGDEEPTWVFKGTISRAMLHLLLTQHQLFAPPGESTTKLPLSTERYTDISDSIHFGDLSADNELSMEELELELNLEPYVNTSAFSVLEGMSLRHAYDLFRMLALRHLTVVNYRNEPVGMITRKDLMGRVMTRRINKRFGTDPLTRIRNLQAAPVALNAVDEEMEAEQAWSSAMLMRASMNEQRRSHMTRDGSVGDASMHMEDRQGPRVGTPRSSSINPRLFSWHRYSSSDARNFVTAPVVGATSPHEPFNSSSRTPFVRPEDGSNRKGTM
jgi:chloride channel 7